MKGKNYHFLIVSIVGLFFGVMVCTIMFKTPIISNHLAEILNTDQSGAGMLFTVYTIVSCVLAVPCVLLSRTIGSKRVVTLGAILAIVGSVLGAISVLTPGIQYTTMLVSRCLEGVCYIFVSICVPVMIGYSVPEEKKGISLSIFAAFIPIGALIGQTVTPVLVSSTGISGTWLIYCAGLVISSILMFVVFKFNPNEIAATSEKTDKIARNSHNPASAVDIIMFLISFSIFCFVQIALLNVFPQKLESVMGLDKSLAGLLATMPTIVAIFTGVVFGRLADKHGTFKKVYVFSLIVLAPGIFLLFGFDGILMIVGFILTCIGMGAPAVNAFAAMEMFSEENGGFGIALNMGFCCLFQALGNAVCPLFLGGNPANVAGWFALAIFLGVITAASVVFAMLCKPGGKSRKERKALAEKKEAA